MWICLLWPPLFVIRQKSASKCVKSLYFKKLCESVESTLIQEAIKSQIKVNWVRWGAYPLHVVREGVDAWYPALNNDAQEANNDDWNSSKKRIHQHANPTYTVPDEHGLRTVTFMQQFHSFSLDYWRTLQHMRRCLDKLAGHLWRQTTAQQSYVLR